MQMNRTKVCTSNLPKLVNLGSGNFSEGTDCNQYGEKKAAIKTKKLTPVRVTAPFNVRSELYHSPTIF